MDRVLALSSGWMLGQFKEMERTMRVVDFAVKLKRHMEERLEGSSSA